MFNAPSGANEFMELYNTSETETIDLNGLKFKIKESTGNADLITAQNGLTLLPPKSFAVVFEGDYDFQNGIYNSLVPASALVLKIGDNAFGSSGMSNTADRTILLLNSANDTLSAYTYSANNGASGSGISDEKILMTSDNSQSNWANSLRVNGTPGFKNSATPINNDLFLSSISASPFPAIDGDDVTIFAKIKNIGLQIADNFTVQIFNDVNFDSVGNLNEQIFNQQFTNLLAGDSISVNVILNSLSIGGYNIIAKVIFLSDEDTSNNFKYFKFDVYPPGNNFNDIVINEIMYAPTSGEPEWIEIFNRSLSAINLKGLSISDNSTQTKVVSNNYNLEANSFLVISKDSSILQFYNVESEIIVSNFPSLNNTGDAVVLKDSLNVLLDSLEYLPNWGGSTGGKSLERILINENSTTQQNWGTSQSINKATPGKVNSITPKNYDLKISSFQPEKKYAIIGETINFQIKIKNVGLLSADNYEVQFFKDLNIDSIPQTSELLSVITGSTIQRGDSAVYIFPTNNFNNGVNQFIAKIFFSVDEDTINNISFSKIPAAQINEERNDIVINEFMYAPTSPQPEWIEIYNRSDKIIDLKNYKIADENDTVTVIKNSTLLNPKEFFVITKDSSIQYYFNVKSKFVKASFPTLNNSGDRIILIDSLNRAIDSLEYLFIWGGNNGGSLERIDADNFISDSTNWASSSSIFKATPGEINSVTQKDFDVEISSIVFNPAKPFFTDDVYVTSKIKNIGKNNSSCNVLLFEDTDLDSIPDLQLEKKSDMNLIAGDSISLTFDYAIKNIQTKKRFFVKIEFAEDQDSSNNILAAAIEPGYSSSSIIINEIMYDPAPAQPEWVELVNISNQNINIKNWNISDLLTTPVKKIITKNNAVINAGEYFIIARDTSFFTVYPEVKTKIFIVNFGTLGNTSDGIILSDFRNEVIDSINYNSAWGGGNDFSLERISFNVQTNDSANWITSLNKNKSTPGALNSLNSFKPANRNDLIINEIMFDPDTDNSEFIEFYNLSDDSLNIGGWHIEDENGNAFKLSQVSLNLPPKSYFILAADSLINRKYNFNEYSSKSILNISSLGLSNSGELILLKDLFGNIIDSVHYYDSWQNKNFISTKNISLERINPILNGNDQFNWSSSVNSSGATPGMQNSIFTKGILSQSNISVSPNPFSPDNDGFEDFTIINYTLTQPIAQTRIKIFDGKGRLVRSLSNNQSSGEKGSIIFDGLDEDNHPLRIGIYIVFIEALNSNSGIVETLKTTLVVARKL